MNLVEVLLWIGVAAIVLIGPFAHRMQVATLWAGKIIAPKGMDKELPRGFQDAITPKIQDNFNTILNTSYLVVLVAGTIQAWYLGILSLFCSFMIVSVLQRLWPRRITFYLKIIIFYMSHRIADYAKEKDHMRSDAAYDVWKKLGVLYLSIKDVDPVLPSFRETNKISLGGYGDKYKK